MERIATGVMELERADAYRSSSGEADPRGWALVGCDGSELGKVRTLLVDTGLMRALYFVCDLASQRTVLLPLTYARLDPSACRVIFDVIDAAACEKLPEYHGVSPTEEESATILAVLTSAVSNCAPTPVDRRQLDRRSA